MKNMRIWWVQYFTVMHGRNEQYFKDMHHVKLAAVDSDKNLCPEIERLMSPATCKRMGTWSLKLSGQGLPYTIILVRYPRRPVVHVPRRLVCPDHYRVFHPISRGWEAPVQELAFV